MRGMITGALVLRPEPGATETAARLEARGIDVIRRPLFAVTPVAWTPPDPADHDALLLTSANAVRNAGAGLAKVARLPVLAVGPAPAAVARAAGLEVAMTGDRDAAALVEDARRRGFMRLLHLAGHDRVAATGVAALTAYSSDPTPLPAGIAAQWNGRAALLHSQRAARRFAELVARDDVDRTTIAVAALSRAVCDAAGPGWARVVVAERPTDAALVAAAAALIDPPGAHVDKSAR